MYFIFFLFSLLGQQVAYADSTVDCSSPHAAVNTLLANQNDGDNLASASCMSGFDKSKGSEQEAVHLAVQLKEILDAKGLHVDMATLSKEADYIHPDENTHKAIVHSGLKSVYLTKSKERWEFNDSVQKSISAIYMESFSPIARNIINWLGQKPFYSKSFIGIKIWQLLLFIALICISIIVGRVINFFLKGQIQKALAKAGINVDSGKLQKFRSPLVLMSIGVVLYWGIPELRLPVLYSKGLFLISNGLVAFSVVSGLSRGVDMLSAVFSAKASATSSKLDDQLIPLISKTLKVLICLAGLLFVLQNLGVKITALVALGSVGGLAVAMASKDTVENLFGSIIVFIDQPFQIGDAVVINGSTEGVIEEVGFRSTRIRAFSNSLITVPNAKIANASIDNIGKREFRRFKVTLSLRYDTKPSLIEAYINKIESLLQNTDIVRKEAIYVYMTNMGAHSLDIMVYTFFITDDWREELGTKQKLMLSFLKMAEEMGIGFAFPTQTIELETQDGTRAGTTPE